ncbi:hypothetical protein JST97_34720 [bacterium]|nr:hypothetical protein [bacterium]
MSVAHIARGKPELMRAGLAPPSVATPGKVSRKKTRGVRGDRRRLSDELKLQKLTERRLKERLKAVLQAKSSGGNASAAAQALAAEYAAAKQSGVAINPSLDQTIRKVLSQGGVGQLGDPSRRPPLGGLLQGLKGNFGGGGGGLGGGFGGGGLGGMGGGLGGNLGATNLNGSGGFGGGGGNAHPAKPLSEQDHQVLAQALQKKDGFGDLITGWRQTREGNCASVAAIKAAMNQYGSDVFRDVQRTADGYQVQLKDGRQVNLSNDEFALARGQAQFAGRDPQALAYAELCYSVLAKQHATNHGVSLMSSCFDLNNGFDPRDAARALGLGNQMTAFNGHDGAVWNNRHAVFKNGDYDLWGQHSGGFGGHSAFSLRPESVPRMPSAQWTVGGGEQADGVGAAESGPQAVQPAPPAEPQTPAAPPAATPTAD